MQHESKKSVSIESVKIIENEQPKVSSGIVPNNYYYIAT